MNIVGHGALLLAMCFGMGEMFLLSMAKCLPSGKADFPLHVSTKQASPRLHHDHPTPQAMQSPAPV